MPAHRTMARALMRAATVAGVATLVALGTALPAAAHVTAQPGEAAQGDFTKIAFRTPNESATAGTVKLEVTLPAEHPISFVSTKPIPGWTAQMIKQQLATPIDTHGEKITEAVRTVTWTAQPGTKIGPGEFTEFEISVGPLPTDTDQLVMPAVQTYDDGTVVRWDEVPPAAGAAEPERPAPVLKLVATQNADPAAADAGASATGSSDNTARWLAGAGVLLGALALGVGIGALIRARRRPSERRT